MKKEKTMHELAKEFPDKTYRELEKYRDADRSLITSIPFFEEAYWNSIKVNPRKKKKS